VASTSAGSGGNGIVSNITGSDIYYGGGGGGGSLGAAPGSGGLGGGGNGRSTSNLGTNGTTNTGGGAGGAGGGTTVTGYNGGSGVLIFRFPSSLKIIIGNGLTFSSSVVGTDNVVIITAGTGTVSWS
jgi:hypothetical protein